MRGRPMPRSATWGTVIVRARREPPPGGQAPAAHPSGLWQPQDLARRHPPRRRPRPPPVYLDEFAFRFNRRRTPMAAFQTLLGLASGIHGPTTYDMLYRSESAR